MNKNNNLDFTEAIQNGINDFGRLWLGKKCYDNKPEVCLQTCKKAKRISFKALLKFLTLVKF